MASLDGEMRRAREIMLSFKTNNYFTELRLCNCVKLFDVRWEWFRRPIHRVGYLLNPYYSYKSHRLEYSEHDFEALTSILARFLPDVNDQAKAMSQFNIFRELGGTFDSSLAQTTIPPHELFGTFGAGFRPFNESFEYARRSVSGRVELQAAMKINKTKINFLFPIYRRKG